MKKEDLEQAIENRKQEVYSYQINIDNYKLLLDILPKDWSEELLEYKGLTSEQIVDNVPEKDNQLVSDLVFRDNIKRTLQVEMLEQSKAIHILKVLELQYENSNMKR